MGNPLGYQADKSLEGESISISALIALDGSSNVIGYLPTTSPLNFSTIFTRAKGLQRAIGQAGSIITQPHTATGVYVFTLDEPWFGAIEAWIQQVDQGAIQQVNGAVDVNVTNTTGSSNYGYFPGQDQTLAAQTVRVRFRTTAAGGALTDPPANSKFFLGLKLRRSGFLE